MKIKSARYFREWYMKEVRHIRSNNDYDTSFLGCNHKMPNGDYLKGFFDLYHGDKPDIGGFLSGFLKIAEDGQAIYEFLQNAADCGSSLFYMFYNEDYFLAVNNGKVFNQAGIQSLLNVTQSTKSNPDQIGRFGIGFKLVHRLVGKGDGMKELIHDYKGPILFSWSKKEDLIDLMNHGSIESVDCIDDKSSLPFLLKILITNFPTEPFEKVKDLDYEDRVLFSETEYAEMCNNVKSNLKQYLATDDFNQGSLFFIKLGEGKKTLLDKDYKENLRSGVEYSLNTLKGLENVKINGTQIKKIPLVLENGTISKESNTFREIDPEYKDGDIHYSIGYNKIDFDADSPFTKVEELKKSPTFYKYFPLGDEIHQSAIFIHCDSISNEANRRKMHEDSINKRLIPEIAKFIIERLESYKEKKDTEGFCQLYVNILLSDMPHDNSDWLKEVYYDILQDYIVSCIPTIKGFSNDASDVKIRHIRTDIPLEIMNNKLQWFKWSDNKNIEELISSAKSKLNIIGYDIVDLIIDANLEKLNKWICTIKDSVYTSFLNELNSTRRVISAKFKDRIKAVKLFRFSDGNFYSYNDLIKYTSDSKYDYIDYTIYSTNKIEGIKNVLPSLDFILSELNIDSFAKIKECFDIPQDERVFNKIAAKIKYRTLSNTEKRCLIQYLTTFENIGDEKIKDLCMCRNESGEIMPLRKLVGRNYKVPTWLSKYQIHEDDYFGELDKFLMSKKAIYREIVYEYWDEIVQTENVKDFYSDVKRLYEIDASNNQSLKNMAYIYTEDGRFVTSDDLIYNDKMLDESLNYKELNNVITTIFEGCLPNKSVASILQDEPFGLKNSNLCDWDADPSYGVTVEDIKSILAFCSLNNETFFKAFVIEYESGSYHIKKRHKKHYQVYTSNRVLLSFISENFGDTMIPLPKMLSNYKNAEGIISEANLHSEIISQIDDVDEYKESLVDFIGYDARRYFINELSQICINLDEDTTADSYSYKIIKMACNALETAEDFQDFRNRLSIIKDGDLYSPDQIPQCVAEHIEVEGAKKIFDLAKILPNEYGNGTLLAEIATKYSSLGIPETKLKKLIGITDAPDIDSVYNTLQSNYQTLVNDQQLAFVLSICDREGNKHPQYKLIAADGEEYSGNYVVKNFDFISESYTLSKAYSHLKEYIDMPYKYKKNIYIEEPYINNENKFICPGLDTTKDEDEIDYSKVISLLNYLIKLYKKNKDRFIEVDWTEFKDYLGFNPSSCLIPKRYAIEDEILPKEIEKWAKVSPIHIEILNAMNVTIESSPVVKFRKYMAGKNKTFDINSLYNVKQIEELQNSLIWISENVDFPLSEEDKYDAVKSVIERINESQRRHKIEVYDEFDIDTIANKSLKYQDDNYDNWEQEIGYSIYLYDGQLPHVVSINKYIGGTIFTYSDGDITTNGENIIYINKEADMQKAMHHLAEDNDINLTHEDVYKLFDCNIVDLRREIQKLKEDNEKLRKNMPVKGGKVAMSGENDPGVDGPERSEWNEQARRKVKSILESENYIFTNGIDVFSDISGVIDPEGNSVPLVVKSCRGGKLFINPAEWGTLLKPKAMLWVFDGQKAYPLHLRDLIRNQDNLVLRMDTRNLDDVSRVSKFAEILRYFTQVHFDFNSVTPTTIAKTYKDYAFDDRPKDEKPDNDEYE